MSIEAYLRSLRRWVGDGPRARRILEEITAHLEDAAGTDQGPKDQAHAVARFGSPARVAFDFFLRTPLVLLERAEPFALLGCTLVTLLFSGAAGFFTTRAVLTEGASAWSFVHLGLACAFAWVILAIWIAMFLRSRVLTRLVRIAGLVVVALGAGGICLATWHGVTTGDWEYYLYIMNGNLVLMGGLMFRYFSRPLSAPAPVVEG